MNLDEFEKYIEDLEIKTNKVFKKCKKICKNFIILNLWY